MAERDPNFNPHEQIFDADFQRRVAIVNLQMIRKKIASNDLQDIEWKTHLTLDMSDEKHFDDINQEFINAFEILGDTNTEDKKYYPHMRVSTLLPVVVKALAERMSSNK